MTRFNESTRFADRQQGGFAAAAAGPNSFTRNAATHYTTTGMQLAAAAEDWYARQ